MVQQYRPRLRKAVYLQVMDQAIPTTQASDLFCLPPKYTVRDFLPLILGFVAIGVFVVLRQVAGGSLVFLTTLTDFLAGFFLVFSVLKFLDWKGFVTAFSSYDVFAKRSPWYGWLYPVIELSIGVMFYVGINIEIAAGLTLLIAFMSSLGVAHQLAHKKRIPCACMGTVFMVPLTHITLAENLLTGFVAGLILAIV